MQDPTANSSSDTHYSPHSAIALPLTVTPHSNEVIVKSAAIPQPFVYEVSCPISCAGVGIGCYNHETCPKPLEAYEFRTTTQRIVSVNVNGDIVCLINQNKPQNKDKKKTDNPKTWGVGLRVREKGNLAVLNPYVIGRTSLSLYTLESPLAAPEKRAGEIYSRFKKAAAPANEYKQVRVRSRMVFYNKTHLCYNNRFEQPNSRTSIVTLVHPCFPDLQQSWTFEQLKKEVNEELHYWLYQLQLTSAALSDMTELTAYPSHNLDVIYTELSKALHLDEQLRCSLLHSEAKGLYQEFYPNHLRLYTAIYRLSSFVNYGNTKFGVERLAEIGFYNLVDGIQRLAHYESPNTHIANIESGQFENERDIVKQQLPFLRSVNGLPFPNIPLKVSLDSHPAYPHSIGSSEIIAVTPQNRYLGVLSKDKTFTLWNTELMLAKLIKVDIKKSKQVEGARTESKEAAT